MCLIADIGVTNVQFAIVGEGVLSAKNERTLSCSEYPALLHAVITCLTEISTFVIESKYPALIGATVAVKQEYSHLGVASIAG